MTQFILASYVAILDELFYGSSNDITWVTDSGVNAGFFGTLDGVNAHDASEPVNQHYATIAAHTEHIRWGLNFALIMLRGEKPTETWDASWKLKAVDAASWEELVHNLKSKYTEFKATVESATVPEDAQANTGLLSVLPHVAYHLGAVRQMIIRL